MNETTPPNESTAQPIASLESVSRNSEGYLTDFSQWSKEVGILIANEEEIELTNRHWEVIEFLQQCHCDNVPLSIRMFGKKGPVPIKELYVLFPGGPLKKSTRIAGICKPASCV